MSTYDFYVQNILLVPSKYSYPATSVRYLSPAGQNLPKSNPERGRHPPPPESTRLACGFRTGENKRGKRIYCALPQAGNGHIAAARATPTLTYNALLNLSKKRVRRRIKPLALLIVPIVGSYRLPAGTVFQRDPVREPAAASLDSPTTTAPCIRAQGRAVGRGEGGDSTQSRCNSKIMRRVFDSESRRSQKHESRDSSARLIRHQTYVSLNAHKRPPREREPKGTCQL